MNLDIKYEMPDDCECAKNQSKPPPECPMVITYPRTTEYYEPKSTAYIYDYNETLKESVPKKYVCTPPDTKDNFFRPQPPLIDAFPQYKRPIGCDVLASYNRVCPDMGDTQCLGFLNEKSTEATWGELKKVLPVKECRLVHLPSKRKIHFNGYFIKSFTPETAEGWKNLKPRKLIRIKQKTK